MVLEILFEKLIELFIPTNGKTSIISKYSQIKKLGNSKSSKLYEFFYLNKDNIHQILYETENIIIIPSNIKEINFNQLFYLILLIKQQSLFTDFIYKFDYIKNINNFRKSNENILKSFILSMIIIELINNYILSDEYYDETYKSELDSIHKENEKIKNDYLLSNKNNFNLEKNEIKNNDLEYIYSKIIISLIKEEKLVDNEFVDIIFNKSGLKEINITEKIFGELLLIFNSNEKYIQKYSINKIEDLYNEQTILFYENLFKFVFKNSFYIYNIPFLLKTRNTILKIIKKELFKIAELNNNKKKEKIINIIKIFCDSKYYDKYIEIKNEQLNKSEKIYVINDESDYTKENNDQNCLSKVLEDIKGAQNNSTKENENQKILAAVTDNTVFNKNTILNNNNKKEAESKVTYIYNSEIQKEVIYYQDSDYYLLDYKETIGKHKNSAEFILEVDNGLFFTGGEDSNIFVYDQNFKKLDEIKNTEWISNISELKSVVKTEVTENEINLIVCKNRNISLISMEKDKFDPKPKKFKLFNMCPSACIEVKKNSYIICSDIGLYRVNDLFSRIIQTKSNLIERKIFNNGIKIKNNIIALTSNKVIRGENKISFYNINSQKEIKEIKGYSFVTTTNGLTLMKGLSKDENNKTLLCACKKYQTGQKNGILVVNTESLKETFYNTGNFEVNCFCPLLLKQKGKYERIFDFNIKMTDTNYFLVGGYYKKKGKGIMKLFKLNRSQDGKEDSIEFIQDIDFPKKNNFNGFNQPISCIKQSTRNGKIIVSCLDGNIYLFSEPNLEIYLKEEEMTKYKYMEMIEENNVEEIVVNI